MEAAKALSEIKKQILIPLVADIHFDYRLAIAAIENGCLLYTSYDIFVGGWFSDYNDPLDFLNVMKTGVYDSYGLYSLSLIHI